jgi:hypothetical protein
MRRRRRRAEDEGEPMRSGDAVALAVAVLLGTLPVAQEATAAVLCKKKRGVVVIRDDACRKRETPVTLSEFGATGPRGRRVRRGRADRARPT